MRPLRVLVVDDSAVVRQILTCILGEEGGFAVEVAADPLFAVRKIDRCRPDVIVLDLEMPRMHGLDFLRQLAADPDPIPVVVCSGLTGPGTDLAIRALEEGAVGIVAKPGLGVRDFLRDSARRLVDEVLSASRVKLRPSRTSRARPTPPIAPSALVRSQESGPVVAIGASTGGPDALRMLLGSLPGHCPPILLVQHMPKHFTAAFARRLDASTALEVHEARHGDVVRRGTVLVAPGDRHLRLVNRAGVSVVELGDEPPICRHRPSVDVLFDSVARAAGSRAVGILLTGMGNDGASGLLAMRRAGARTIAQDEATCAVFGMPREAIALGAVDEVVPLDRVAHALLAQLRHLDGAGAESNGVASPAT